MKIAGQNITTTEKHLRMALKEPFWGAWKTYGWSNRDPGLGVSINLIRQADKEKKRIMVSFNGVDYETSVKKMQAFYNKAQIKPIFKARGDYKIIVFPISLFERVKKEEERTQNEQQTLL